MQVTFNNEGLTIDGKTVTFPCHLDQLLELFGPGFRKVFGTQNIYIYEDRGVYFYNNSSDKLSEGVLFSFGKKYGYQPEQPFSGTLQIGDHVFDMADAAAAATLHTAFEFPEDETVARRLFGDYRVHLSLQEDGTPGITGITKVVEVPTRQPRPANYDTTRYAAPTAAFDIEFTASDSGDGWAFGQPKGLATVQWPRSNSNGIPLSHLFTVKVPEDYRVHGPEYVAIALFYGDVALYNSEVHAFLNEATSAIPEDGNAAFWHTLSAYRSNKHPKAFALAGEFDDEYALVWLTQAELDGAVTALPENDLPYDLQGLDYSRLVYTDAEKPAKYLQLVERADDPNAGKSTTDDNDDLTYIPMYSDRGEELGLERFWGKQHFGGTSSPCQVEQRDFTPFYLEFSEQLGNANFGGDGVAQLDLLANKLAWQCG